MNLRSSLARTGALLAVAALLGACDSPHPTEPLVPDMPTLTASEELLTAEDSARFLAERRANPGARSQSLQSFGGGITIRKGSSVTVTVISSECASKGTQLVVSGATGGVVTSDACYDAGATATFGPAEGSGELFFAMVDPRFGTGSFQVSGSHPSYTVYMEDGYGDGDYNDAVLSVTVEGEDCPLFDSPTGDPALDDPDIQAGIKEIWEKSDVDNPRWAERKEHSGYYVEKNGEVFFVEKVYLKEPSICGVASDPDQRRQLEEQGYRIVGDIHTHPLEPGQYKNPGCDNFASEILNVAEGPSTGDYETWEAQNAAYPHYVITKTGFIYRVDADGNLTPISFNTCQAPETSPTSPLYSLVRGGAR